MQKLVCELCRSNDFTRDDDGFFVCDYCRTKYTPAQAKSMIVEGTVRVDRSGDVASLVTLAGIALSGRNVQEAFDYSNRALEIDPINPTAWCIKGSAAGWLSTMEVPRFRELHHAYTLALEHVDGGERPAMLRWCAERTTEITGYLADASWTYAKQYPTAPGVWDQHTALAEEALSALGSAYQWCPNPTTLTTYTLIACDLVRGIPYERPVPGKLLRLVHLVPPEHRANLQQRIDWAGDQMRLFDPSFVTPRPKPSPRPSWL